MPSRASSPLRDRSPSKDRVLRIGAIPAVTAPATGELQCTCLIMAPQRSHAGESMSPVFSGIRAAIAGSGLMNRVDLEVDTGLAYGGGVAGIGP